MILRFVAIAVAFFVLIFYAVWIWKRKPYAIALGTLFLVEIAWQFISIVWIDGGTHISEQLRDSYYTGASFRYIILMAPFAISFPVFLQRFSQKKRMERVRLRIGNTMQFDLLQHIGVAAVLVLGYLFLNMFLTGSPLLSDYVTKSNYYSVYSRLPFCNAIQQYLLPFIALMLGVATGKNRQSRNKLRIIMPILLMGGILLYQLLMDNKFYGLYDYVLYYLLPVLTMDQAWIQEKKRKIPVKLVIVVAAAMLALIALSYTKYVETRDNPLDYLLERLFALQSHTFWGVDLAIQSGQIKFDLWGFINEVIAGIGGVSRLDKNYGIARVMYLVTLETYANDMLSTGFLFAGSYLTVMMSYLGYIIPFFFSFALSWLIAKVCALVVKYIESDQYLILFLAFFVYRRFYEYFRVGNVAMVLNWKFILVYLLFGFIYLAEKRRRTSAV